MKKSIVMCVVLSLAAIASAGLFDWYSDTYFAAPATGVQVGYVVALYQDVGGDNSSLWNSATGQMVVNTDLTVSSGLNGMGNDVLLATSYVAEPFFPAMALNASSLDLADNMEVYTVWFNNTSAGISISSLGAVDDAATVNIGAVEAPDDAFAYNIGSDAANGSMGGVSVVPEPATAMLLAFGGGLAWLVRLKQRLG